MANTGGNMIDNLNKTELLELIEKSEQRIAQLDKEEAEKEKSPVILQVGKTYKARNGDKIMIITRNMSVYTGLNQSYRGNNIYDKHPEFYINGRRSKVKLLDGDLIEEIKNG